LPLRAGAALLEPLGAEDGGRQRERRVGEGRSQLVGLEVRWLLLKETSMSLDVIFATIVGVLAGLAVIGALAFALVWEWCAIRRTLAANGVSRPTSRLARPYGAEDPRAAVMKTAARWLLVGWLVAALVLLGIDGRLPEFLVGATSGSLLLLALGALVRQQLAPSRHNRPPLPDRYRVASDLAEPIAAVVAAAERKATAGRQPPPAEVRHEHWDQGAATAAHRWRIGPMRAPTPPAWSRLACS
jgi:hypothetical protein